MSTFSDAYEVTAADRTGKGVTGLPDTPGYTTLAMQQQFDSLANLGINKFNAMVNAAETSITSSDTKFPTSKAAKDYADGIKATVEAEIPTKTSELANDSDFVSDASYVHTDNNYTTTEKSKLSGIAAGAEVNVQSDWNQSDNTKDDYVKNKPTALSQFSDDSTHRLVTDTEKSTWNGKQNALTFDNAPTSGSNNPVKSGGVYSAEQDIYEVMGVNGAKNIYPYDRDTIKLNNGGAWTDYSCVLNGITFNLKEDGTIVVTGTATSNVNFYIFSKSNVIEYAPQFHGKILNGCPSGGSSSTYRIRCVLFKTSSSSSQYIDGIDDVGSGVTIPDNAEYNYVRIAIQILNGYQCPIDGVTFKPMLRLAADTDSTYQPYAMTNKELTESATVKTLTLTAGANVSNINNIFAYQIGKVVYITGFYQASANMAAKEVAISGLPKPKASTDMTRPMCYVQGNFALGSVEGNNFYIRGTVNSADTVVVCFSYVAE